MKMAKRLISGLIGAAVVSTAAVSIAKADQPPPITKEEMKKASQCCCRLLLATVICNP